MRLRFAKPQDLACPAQLGCARELVCKVQRYRGSPYFLGKTHSDLETRRETYGHHAP